MIAALAAAWAASPATAFFNDRLEVFATGTYTYDSNVFRLSDNVDPVAATGSSSLGDRILSYGIGAALDWPVSLQRFRASYHHFWNRYDKFDHLDFDGHVARASWDWAVTREFSGDIGASETEGLASFAAFGGTTRDVVTTRQFFASGSWLMTPRWLSYVGALGTERKHEDRTRRANDMRAKSLEGRLSYVTPKENHFGVSVRVEEGEVPEDTFVSGIRFDNHYKQWGVGAVVRWDVTPHSRLDGRVDYVDREYDQFTERNYDGPAFGVTYTWTPSPKFQMLTTFRRDIGPMEDVQTSFVVTTGASVKPRWQVTEKFAVLGSVDYSIWKYKQPIGGDFEHRVRGALVGFTWAPYQRIVVNGTLAREVRTSDLENADYKVTIGTIDARIGF